MLTDQVRGTGEHVSTEGAAIVGRGWLIKKCDSDQLGKSDQ